MAKDFEDVLEHLLDFIELKIKFLSVTSAA